MTAFVNRIITAEQGRYSWPRRNCITTAMALYESLASAPDPFVFQACAHYLSLPEREAWRQIMRLGGPLMHHESVLGAGAVRVDAMAPGDIVFLAGDIRIGNHSFAAGDGREAMGFVDGGHSVLHWTPDGMRPVTAPWPDRTVLRFT